ncbi:MAG TPA: hypothetical protein GX506_08970 [Firmicutes bacterium]|nr:hypothetical protein [Bacillota bacterium]
MTVGIPRALLYYYYYPMWATFFKELGADVVVSRETNKGLLDQGVRLAVDEACMPVKVFFGHVASLLDSADRIFVPRLVSVERRAFICPKFMGLPDMIRAAMPADGRLIDPCIDLSKNEREFHSEIMRTGSIFTRSRVAIHKAYQKSKVVLRRFKDLLVAGNMPESAISLSLAGHDGAYEGYTGEFGEVAAANQDAILSGPDDTISVGILGHPYLIYDSYASMSILSRLRDAGCRVITCDMLPDEVVEKEAQNLPRWLFWTLGRRILGAAFHFLHSRSVDGCLHITAFGCGLDSIVGELIEREAKRSGDIPLMSITLDEHTGEAGVVTRVEAFMDMLRRRKSA